MRSPEGQIIDDAMTRKVRDLNPGERELRHNGINVERTQRSARSALMRGVASIVAFGLLVAGLTVMPTTPAEAAVVQWGTNAGTSPSYQTTVNGDFLMAGNGVLACNRPLYTAAQIGTCTDLHSASGGNGNTANDNFYLENSNTVAGFTTNSSSANITIPAGASVEKAILSWSANTGSYTGVSDYACATPNATRGIATMPAGSATGYRTSPAKLQVGLGPVTTVAPTTMLEDPVGTSTSIYFALAPTLRRPLLVPPPERRSRYPLVTFGLLRVPVATPAGRSRSCTTTESIFRPSRCRSLTASSSMKVTFA